MVSWTAVGLPVADFVPRAPAADPSRPPQSQYVADAGDAQTHYPCAAQHIHTKRQILEG